MRTRFFIFLMLLSSITNDGAPNTYWNLLKYPGSLQSTSTFSKVCVDNLANLVLLKNMRTQSTQTLPNERCIFCNETCVFEITAKDPPHETTIARCTSDDHIRQVGYYYGSLLAEGALAGAYSYITLHYLYTLGLSQAATRLGISFISTQIAYKVFDETLKGLCPVRRSIMCSILAVIIQQGIKSGLTHATNIQPSYLTAPHRIQSLWAGTFMNYTNISFNNALATFHEKSLTHHVFIVPDYYKPPTAVLVKEVKKHELTSILMKFLGVALGVYVAQKFIEKPLHFIAHVLTYYTKQVTPIVLQKMI